MNSIAITSLGSPVLSEVYRWIRRNLEWLVAAAAFAAIGWRAETISGSFASGTWNLGAFYSAAFNWAAIQGAFLFSVYAFFLSRSEPFIQAIAKTEAFQALRSYVLRALWLSMALTLIVLPLLVSPPAMSQTAGFTVAFGIFWFVSVLLTYTFMCFVKVIRVFRKLEAMQD
jgi:hypothetical protein